MKYIIFILTLLFTLSSCESSDPITLDDLYQTIENFGQDTLSSDDSNIKTAVDEFKKLQQFEYKIFTFDNNISEEELEIKLNSLGLERWDCFSITMKVISKNPEFIVTCKRKPYTPLRIATSLLGR